jgi:hypothetical protein
LPAAEPQTSFVRKATEYETPTGEPGHFEVTTGIRDLKSGEQVVSVANRPRRKKNPNESWQEFIADGRFIDDMDGAELVQKAEAGDVYVDKAKGVVVFKKVENSIDDVEVGKPIIEALCENYGTKYKALTEVLAQF